MLLNALCSSWDKMIEQQQLNFAASLFGCIRSSQGDRIDTWLCTWNPAIDISKNASHKGVIIHHNSHSFSVVVTLFFTCHLFRLDTVTGRSSAIWSTHQEASFASSSPVQYRGADIEKVPFSAFQGTVSIMSFKQICIFLENHRRRSIQSIQSIQSIHDVSECIILVMIILSSSTPNASESHFCEEPFPSNAHHESSTQSTVRTTSVPLLYRKTMKNKSCEQQTDQYAVQICTTYIFWFESSTICLNIVTSFVASGYLESVVASNLALAIYLGSTVPCSRTRGLGVATEDFHAKPGEPCTF